MISAVHKNSVNLINREHQQSRKRNPYSAGANSRGNKNVSFGLSGTDAVNWAANGINYLRQNPVAEVFFLDATTMVAPRTAEDYQQNPVYGTETLFREAAPIVFNPFGPGIVAALYMAAKGYKDINAGADMLEGLHKAWQGANGESFHVKGTTDQQKFDIVKGYHKRVLSETHGTYVDDAGKSLFKPLSEEKIEELSEELARLTLGGKDKKDVKKGLDGFAKAYTLATGAENDLKFKLAGKEAKSAGIRNIAEDAVSTAKNLFTQEKFAETAKELSERVKNIASDSRGKKSLLAVGLSIAGIITLPAINNAITKFRTGKSGYAAYQDFGKSDELEVPKDKKRLWRAKAIGTAVIGGIMLATMGAFSPKKDRGFFVKKGLENFRKNILELKGKDAHMDMIKLIYGSSLMARVLCSRDDQEVKTTTIRDSCGFMNWLVLGPFVTKGVAHIATALNKKGISYINKTGPIIDTEGKNVFMRTFNTVRNWLGNVSTKTLGEMKATKGFSNKELLTHTGANAAGIGWSMFALGFGMPLLNNYMTNKAREKQLKALSQKEYNKTSPNSNNRHITIADALNNKTTGGKVSRPDLYKTIAPLSFTNSSVTPMKKEEIFERFMQKQA